MPGYGCVLLVVVLETARGLPQKGGVFSWESRQAMWRKSVVWREANYAGHGCWVGHVVFTRGQVVSLPVLVGHGGVTFT